MNISKLTVTQFRNYTAATVLLSQGTNIIYGNNAQGKTNLLESIYVFCTGRSHRVSNSRDMILNGETFARVDIEFSDDIRSYKGHIIIPESGKKTVVINDVPIKKISTIADYINVVMFSPEDLSIIKDEPAQRRKFIDMAICQIRPVYAGILADYSKVLIQRNAMLKSIKRGTAKQENIEVWDSKLLALSARITMFRKGFIDTLTPYAAAIHSEIACEPLELRYMPCSKDDIDTSSEPAVLNNITERLRSSIMRDIEAGNTSIGAHHDDLEAYIAGQNAKRFGSQGQQRSVVLSLKLGQTEIIKAQKGSYPVILLDDIMSELDESRRRYLTGRIVDKQVIMTCTDRETAMDQAVADAHGEAAYFKVADRCVMRDL